MPSPLDIRIKSAVDTITGTGGPMPLVMHHAHGVDLPMIATAPPALSYYFAHFCAQHGEATFIVDGSERLSYAQTYAAAVDVATALVRSHGLKRGDRVGIAMRNAPSWIVLYMGIIIAGGCATLLNGWWQGNELAAGIDDVGASLVLVDPQRAARLSDFGYSGATVVTLDIAQRLDDALAPLMAAGGDNLVYIGVDRPVQGRFPYAQIRCARDI
jgi:long-chain acyl-CoA synthetase